MQGDKGCSAAALLALVRVQEARVAQLVVVLQSVPRLEAQQPQACAGDGSEL